jgi:hypothetical protein
MKYFPFLPLFILSFCLPPTSSVCAQSAQNGNNKLTFLRTPNGGIQPQVVMDARGALRLIYFVGEAGGGDKGRQGRRGASPRLGRALD